MKNVLHIATCRAQKIGEPHPSGLLDTSIVNDHHLFKTRMFTQNPDYIDIIIEQIKAQQNKQFTKLFNPNNSWGFCKDQRAPAVVAEINNRVFDAYICEISSMKYRDNENQLLSYTFDEFVEKINELISLVGQKKIILIGTLNYKIPNNIINQLGLDSGKIINNRLKSRVEIDRAIDMCAKYKIFPQKCLDARSNVATMLQDGISTHHYSRDGAIKTSEYITQEVARLLI